MDSQEVAVLPGDIEQAKRDLRPVIRAAFLSLCLLALLNLAVTIGIVAIWFPHIKGAAAAATTTVVTAIVGAPLLAFALYGGFLPRVITFRASLQARERHARELASFHAFQVRVGRGLEMAEAEFRVHELIERSLVHVIPDARTELLMEGTTPLAALECVAVQNEPPSCSVGERMDCPAIRNAQTLHFSSSDHLDACPHLRERGPCVARCQPVLVGGQALGVLHTLLPEDATIDARTETMLDHLVDHAGTRLTLLRSSAETQLAAATDPLTGLLNRRSFDARVRAIGRAGMEYAVVLADIDHFKNLNDTHGHDVGDRALRVMAHAMRNSVRPEDIICRYGGEEFALVLPNCDERQAAEIIMRIREDVALAVDGAGLPKFTTSFGVASSFAGSELAEQLRAADMALYEAKERGRDRVEFATGL